MNTRPPIPPPACTPNFHGAAPARTEENFYTAAEFNKSWNDFVTETQRFVAAVEEAAISIQDLLLAGDPEAVKQALRVADLLEAGRKTLAVVSEAVSRS